MSQVEDTAFNCLISKPLSLLQFENCLSGMETRLLYRQYLAASMADEMYEFYDLCQEYATLDSPELRRKQVCGLYF